MVLFLLTKNPGRCGLKTAYRARSSTLCLQHYTSGHIRPPEGKAQQLVRFSARPECIRPQRKFACSRFFQISVMVVPSFL